MQTAILFWEHTHDSKLILGQWNCFQMQILPSHAASHFDFIKDRIFYQGCVNPKPVNLTANLQVVFFYAALYCFTDTYFTWSSPLSNSLSNFMLLLHYINSCINDFCMQNISFPPISFNHETSKTEHSRSPKSATCFQKAQRNQQSSRFKERYQFSIFSLFKYYPG